jgi:predicted nuclease of predicted toxin-antitoxin system
MNLIADEGVDRQIVELLRNEGHEVLSIAELKPGISDDEVINYTNKNGSLLITSDRDFGELVYRMKRSHFGIILIRLAGIPPHKKAELVSKTINEHSEKLMFAFTVISNNSVRIRH